MEFLYKGGGRSDPFFMLEYELGTSVKQVHELGKTTYHIIKPKLAPGEVPTFHGY